MMKILYFIFLLFITGQNAYAQITIDLKKKSAANIENDIEFKAPFNSVGRFVISNASYPNSSFYEFGLELNFIGCPTLITYNNKTKLIAANFSGELFFYDLPTGRLEKNISFRQLGSEMLKTTGVNKNSIIASMSLTDDENYLVFKTYNFNGATDQFVNYYVLDLRALESINISRHLYLWSLYAFPKMELLNESKILNASPKYFQEKAIATVQALSKSKLKFQMNNRFDGVYFTANNLVPLKFINLGDNSYFKAIDYFTNPQSHFNRNNSISNISEFTETISSKYLLNDIIQNSNGTFALFGTSYGSKNNAVLAKIDDLLHNVEQLYEKAISEINNYFQSKIITPQENIIEYKKDKLYLKHEAGKYYFVGPWLDQSINCDRPLNIWGNSYQWKYFKAINELNNLNLKYPILFETNTLGKYCFIGWEENKLCVFNLTLNPINNFDNPLSEYQLSFKSSLINKIDFNSLLPVNNNSESVVDKQPSKDIGQRSCEVCAGTGIVPDRVRNGYIRTYQRNPISGGPVKCFNCNGSGKYTLVSGNYEKKKILQFDKWSLADIKVCNSNQIIVVFETHKRTFIQESRGGYLTKGELASNEKLVYSFIIDKNGKVILSDNGDMRKKEICGVYSPVLIDK